MTHAVTQELCQVEGDSLLQQFAYLSNLPLERVVSHGGPALDLRSDQSLCLENLPDGNESAERGLFRKSPCFQQKVFFY